MKIIKKNAVRCRESWLLWFGRYIYISDDSFDENVDGTEIDGIMQNYLNITFNESEMNISLNDIDNNVKESVEYNKTGGSVSLPTNTDVKGFKYVHRMPSLDCQEEIICDKCKSFELNDIIDSNQICQSCQMGFSETIKLNQH